MFHSMKGRFTVVHIILWVAMIPDAVINGADGAIKAN